MTDVVDDAREALRALLVEAHERVITSAETLAEYKGGTAIFDTERDCPLSDLAAFAGTVESLRRLPAFMRAFGAEHDQRATLQFIYDYFTRAVGLAFEDAAFEATFEAFISEIDNPNWTFVAFANLRNVRSDDAFIDFGDGISIRRRSLEEIEERLGWTDWHLDALERDWREGHSPSGYVVWVESVRDKSPDTAILSDSATGTGRILDLLLALWLFATGDLSIGAIFNDSAAKFDLRGGGLTRTNGMPGEMWGREYVLSASDAPDVRAILDDVVAFRRSTEVPSNVRLAVRRFESVYTRSVRQREDRIIDELIALEALAGSGTELRFRLAFRISSILAADDDERLALFEAIKRYYDVRSKLVHGSELRAAENALVKDDDELRAIVRRLVRGVIFAAVHTDIRLTASYIDTRLDKVLLNAPTRQKLREALALE
jgi:Apea-like HEPN